MHTQPGTIIALLSLLFCGTSQAWALADGVVTGQGKFGCRYQVYHHSIFSRKSLYPTYYSNIITGSNNLTHCIKQCDNHNHCVATSFRPIPKRKQRPFRYSTCEQVIQPGFSKQAIVAKPVSNHTIVQLVPDSCKKAVATPTPFSCEPRIITDKGGCKFKVVCNEELSKSNHFLETAFHNLEECINYASNLKHGFGFTFYQGGDCYVNTARSERHINKTFRRPNCETGQIVPGSCPKASPPFAADT